jgi:quercetin dioxygenase-like cupin family protein/DNA-binding XRE family transcriptional regulator
MKEKIKQIAVRIKELREIAGHSIETLAAEFKVTQEEYLKYESGKVDIPVSFLYEVAHKFKVELTTLLTGGEPHLEGYNLVRKGDGPSVERRKEYKYNDLAYNFKHKKAEIFLVTIDPDKSGVTPHFYAHPGQEFNYILAGSVKIILDGHELDLAAGDSLYFNSTKKHALQATGDTPATLLAVIL